MSDVRRSERAMRSAIRYLVATVVVTWFAYLAAPGLLLLFLAIVFAIALLGPIRFLERRGMPHGLAVTGALFIVLAMVAGLFWLVIPRLVEQLTGLLNDLPSLLAGAGARLSSLFAGNPELQKAIVLDSSAIKRLAPEGFQFVLGIGGWTFTLLEWVASIIVFLSAIVYVTANPGVVLSRYLECYPRSLRPRKFRGRADRVGFGRSVPVTHRNSRCARVGCPDFLRRIRAAAGPLLDGTAAAPGRICRKSTHRHLCVAVLRCDE